MLWWSKRINIFKVLLIDKYQNTATVCLYTTPFYQLSNLIFAQKFLANCFCKTHLPIPFFQTVRASSTSTSGLTTPSSKIWSMPEVRKSARGSASETQNLFAQDLRTGTYLPITYALPYEFLSRKQWSCLVEVDEQPLIVSFKTIALNKFLILFKLQVGKP